MSAVAVAGGVIQVLRRQRGFALDLRSCGREKVDVHGVMKASGAQVTAYVTCEVRAWVACVGACVCVWWRHVGRRKSRVGSGLAHVLGGWRHHLVELGQVAHLAHLVHLIHLVQVAHLVHLLKRGVVLIVVEQTGLRSSSGGGGGSGMLLVASARVGVVVYS